MVSSQPATGVNPPLPKAMVRLDQLEEHFEKINMNYASLKDYLGRFAKTQEQ